MVYGIALGIGNFKCLLILEAFMKNIVFLDIDNTIIDDFGKIKVCLVNPKEL